MRGIEKDLCFVVHRYLHHWSASRMFLGGREGAGRSKENNLCPDDPTGGESRGRH